MNFFRNSLTIILLSLTVSFMAQGGFRKKHYLQNSLTSVCRDAIELPNGNMIMTGFTLDTSNNQSVTKLTLIGTDPLGNILWRKNYGSLKFKYLDNYFKPRSIEVTEANVFYQTLGVRDSNNKQIGVLIKFDYNGDTLWQKIYRENDPKDIIPQAMARSVDNGFLITGASQEPSGLLCLLIKTDINGNELWRKRISKSIPNVQDGQALIQDSTSKKIIIVGYQSIGNSTLWDTYSNILILDSLGNKLIQTTFNNAGGSGFGELIQLKDKNFMTSGSWKAYDHGNTTYYKGIVVKFDINGNTIWSKIYDLVSPFSGIGLLNEIPNGDIMMLGFIDTLYSNSLVKPQIMRTDKNGNIKWKREIGTSFNTYAYNIEYGRSLSPMQNGGFLISTQFPYSPNPRPYSIIKVDSTGCDTTEAYCLSVVLGIDKLNELKGWSFDLFPNPASDAVNIKIEASAEEVFTLKITDISGRELEKLELEDGTELKLNTTSYQSGVYFVTVFHKQKALETKRLLIGR